MLEIEKWAVGKPLLLAGLAMSHASSAKWLAEALEEIKTGRFDIEGPLPPVNKWLGYYRQRRKVWASVEGQLEGFEGSMQGFLDVVNREPEQEQGPGSLVEFSDQEINKLEAFFGAIIEDIKEGIAEEGIGATSGPGQGSLKKGQQGRAGTAPVENGTYPLDSQGQGGPGHGPEAAPGLDMDGAEVPPEYWFMLLVWFPCYFLYGEMPPVLYRRARSGDIEALKVLLRVDSSVAFDKRISEIIHQARVTKRQVFDELMEAMRLPPKGKVSDQKIKVSMAGKIAAMFDAFDCSLTEPEIRDLFDAVSRDFGRGEIDTDLPESPEAFSKAFRREKPFWKGAFQVGQK